MKKLLELKNKKGFTLVEVIIVLVIIAILAGVLIPSLVGYIDKANERAIIAEAKGIFTAAQTALSECYAEDPAGIIAAANKKYCYPEDRKTVYENVGRVSDNSFYRIQNNRNLDDEYKATADYKIALQILKYIDSETSTNPRYDYTSGIRPYNNSKHTVEDFFAQVKKSYNTPNPVTISVYYGTEGKIDVIQFGKGDYLCTVTADSVVCATDTFLINSPD